MNYKLIQKSDSSRCFCNDLMLLMHVSNSVYVKQSVKNIGFSCADIISTLPSAWLKGCGWKNHVRWLSFWFLVFGWKKIEKYEALLVISEKPCMLILMVWCLIWIFFRGMLMWLNLCYWVYSYPTCVSVPESFFQAGNDRCGGVGPLGCKLPRREAVDKGS